MHGGLGGAMQLSLGYARQPAVRQRRRRIAFAVVSDQAFADFGAALTYDRWRFYLNFDSPLAINGQSGVVGGYPFTGPSVISGRTPTASPMFGSAPTCGSSGSRAAVSASAPARSCSSRTSNRRRLRHRRRLPRDDPRARRRRHPLLHIRRAARRPHPAARRLPTPGGPRGSELLFGVAGGAKLPVGRAETGSPSSVPRSTARRRSSRSSAGTAPRVEGLLSGRLEGTRDNKAQLRVKLGFGAGLNPAVRRARVARRRRRRDLRSA